MSVARPAAIPDCPLLEVSRLDISTLHVPLQGSPVPLRDRCAVEIDQGASTALLRPAGLCNGEMTTLPLREQRPSPAPVDWARALRRITTLAALGVLAYWSFGRSNFTAPAPENTPGEPTAPAAVPAWRQNWATFEQLMRKAWG